MFRESEKDRESETCIEYTEGKDKSEKTLGERERKDRPSRGK